MTRAHLAAAADLFSNLLFSLSPGQATGQRVPVLCYHRLLPGFQEPETRVMRISPEAFETHLIRLRQAGFTFLSLGDYAELAAGRRQPPPRSVLLTIDDGYADVLPLLPAIDACGARLTLFLVTSFIGQAGPRFMSPPTPAMKGHAAAHPDLWRSLTWEEVRHLAENGVDIGLHGHRHLPLASLGPDELARDLAQAAEIFRQELGRAPTTFALPYGNPAAFSSGALQALRNAGLDLVFSTITGRSPLPTRRSPLSRLVVLHRHTPEDIEKMALGARDWLGSIRRRLAPSITTP